MTHSRRPTICRVVPGAIKALGLLLPILLTRPLLAQGRVYWQEGGVVLCDTSWDGGGDVLAAVPDGRGGAVVVWPDYRGNFGSIYAQRVNQDGETLWPANGVMLKNHAYSARWLRAVPDGQGGLIAVWVEYACWPNLIQVTAQRVDSAGNVRWGPNGVVLAGSGPANDYDYHASIAPDGHGGAVVATLRRVCFPDSTVDSVCLQRLDSLGQSVWPQGTVMVDTQFFQNDDPGLSVADDGRIYLGWTLNQNGCYSTLVQCADPAGNLLWPAPGISPCTTSTSAYLAGLTAGSRSCVAAFASGGEIRVQRLDTSARRLWGGDGVCAFPASVGTFFDVVMRAADSGSTALVCEARYADTMNIHAQKLAADGSRLWGNAGVYVGTVGARDGQGLDACTDANGGLIVAWPTMRRGTWDLYAQHLDRYGTRVWSDTGLGVATGPGSEFWEPCVVPDSEGGAVVAWGFQVLGPGYGGIRAQRCGDVPHGMSAPAAGPLPSGVRIWPNVVSGAIKMELSGIGATEASLELFDLLGRRVACVWRGVCTRPLALSWTPVDDRGARIPDGVYYVVLKDGGGSTKAAVLTIVGQ